MNETIKGIGVTSCIFVGAIAIINLMDVAQKLQQAARAPHLDFTHDGTIEMKERGRG